MRVRGDDAGYVPDEDAAAGIEEKPQDVVDERPARREREIQESWVVREKPDVVADTTVEAEHDGLDGRVGVQGGRNGWLFRRMVPRGFAHGFLDWGRSLPPPPKPPGNPNCPWGKSRCRPAWACV